MKERQKFLVERAKAEMDGTPAKCTKILGTFEVQPTAEDDEDTMPVNEGRPVHSTKVNSMQALGSNSIVNEPSLEGKTQTLNEAKLSLAPGLNFKAVATAREESGTSAMTSEAPPKVAQRCIQKGKRQGL